MATKRAYLLGQEARKLQPRLRLYANGNPTVNAVRAEIAPSLAVSQDSPLAQMDMVYTASTSPRRKSELPSAERGQLEGIAQEILVDVFIETADASDPARNTFKLPLVSTSDPAQRANLVTATVPLSDLKQLSEEPGVRYVEAAQGLAMPRPIISRDEVSPPRASRLNVKAEHNGGEGVLIGIIDVGGFDFSHPDFLDDAGHTRFVRIWDQGGDTHPGPTNVPSCNYGAEFTQAHLNTALAGAADMGIPAYELEPQSQMETSSHATHVASIAAGGKGICPKAMIAGVLISLPKEDLDRRLSFYDSVRVAHAIDYLVQLSEDLGRERNPGGEAVPLSINISLGTNGHAHDASAAISRWIDATLAVPGRSVCVAAGNAGQELAAFEGDIGYVMGRIHTSGRVSGRGLNRDIEWVVVGNGVADISENEFELWYSPQDRFAVSLRPPGLGWIGPVEPGQFIENRQLPDGSFISIYNEVYHPANGSNYISIYLSPYFSTSGPIGVRAGKWMVRLHGREVRDGSYDGWIERDDPYEVGRVGLKEAWRFPSFFAEASNVDQSSVSSLACGRRIISVGNLDADAERISNTSSQGPTRDKRFKPDVAAPGTKIVAANGFAGPDDLWIAMSGTSMASPYVAGVVGLLLSVAPRLTAAQIEGIIQSTAQPLPGADYGWVNDAGFGRIDPQRCLEEAVRINRREDITG